MIYNLVKRGYQYINGAHESLIFGYYFDVYRTNTKEEISKEELNKMLNDNHDTEYLKLSKRKIYIAYILYRDKMDSNEKLRDHLFNIVFYLTKNKYTRNCEKLEDFYKRESSYYLIIEKIN